MEAQLVIDGLVFHGTHGAYEEERKAPQLFTVRLEITLDIGPSAASDNLVDTLDWGWAADQAREVIEGETCYLVEKLAARIHSRIFADQRIRQLTVVLGKKEAWETGFPAVRLCCTR